MKKDNLFIFTIIFVLLIILVSEIFAQSILPEENQSMMLNLKGINEFAMNDFASARKSFNTGTEKSSVYLDPITSAVLVNNLACVDFKDGKSDTKNIESLENVYDKLMSYNRAVAAYSVLNNIAVAEMRKGEYREAVEKLDRASKQASKNLNRKSEGIALNNMSICYRELKEFDKAVIVLDRAYSIFDNIDYKPGISNVYYNKGKIYLALEKPEIAKQYFLLAEGLDKKNGDKINLEKTRQALSECDVDIKKIKSKN